MWNYWMNAFVKKKMKLEYVKICEIGLVLGNFPNLGNELGPTLQPTGPSQGYRQLYIHSD